jgi:hypothetical protein
MPHFDSVTPDLPWRVDKHRRPELLRWFLDVDLKSSEACAEIRRRIGRGAGIPARSLELGQYAAQWGWSDKKLADFYLFFRTMFLKARGERALELKNPKARRSGSSFETLRRYLVDVHPWIARDADYQVELPESIDHVSSTLVGELALAMLLELLDARTPVVCRICHQVRLFDDDRERKICGDPACVSADRKRWKSKNVDKVRAERIRRQKKRARAKRAEKGGRK